MDNIVAFVCGLLLLVLGISTIFPHPFFAQIGFVETSMFTSIPHLVAAILLIFSSFRSHALGNVMLKSIGSFYLIMAVLSISMNGMSTPTIVSNNVIISNEYTFVYLIGGLLFVCLGIASNKNIS